MADPLLDDLTEAQRRAVTAEGQPVCIVAGAGAGKTRVLTRRIAYRIRTGQASPDHVMVVTFTRKAAVELGHRLNQLGLRDRVAAGTFHSLATAQLRSWWADRGQRPPSLLDRKGRLLAEILAGRPGLGGLTPAEAASHIEWAKARLIEPAAFARVAAEARRPLPVPGRELAALFARYEDEKRRRGVVDFDDLLAMCRVAFETDAAFAAAQRWRWRHIFVDEFQDLNPLQDGLLLAWLGSNTDLCAVGDPNQAIYGWNGADSKIFEQVPARWATTEVIRLDQNHRCTPQVVTAAAGVLGPAGRLLRSSRPDGPPVEVRGYATDADEAAGVAQALRRAHANGLAWSQLAVLVRTNAQIRAFAEALDARQVPHRAPGFGSLLGQPAVVAALNDARRQARRPFQVVVGDLRQLASSWPESDSGRLGDPAAGGGDPAGADPLAGGVRGAGGDRGAGGSPVAGGNRGAGGVLVAGGADEEQAAALSTLADLAEDYARLDRTASVAGFEAWLAATLRQEGAADDGHADSVTICTFHRAKGLEWPAVWVCGLEEGLVPHSAATGPARDEERRLLYVALTRAERELHCSYAGRRRFGNNLVPRQASPWLDLIDARVAKPETDVDPATARARWFAHLQASRDRLVQATSAPAASPEGDAPGSQRAKHRRQPGRGRQPLLPAGWPTPDPAVLNALRSWRADLARRSGIPAGVLLHDVTLQALASLRPSTERELADMPGFGPVQASRYGPKLLPLVADPRESA